MLRTTTDCTRGPLRTKSYIRATTSTAAILIATSIAAPAFAQQTQTAQAQTAQAPAVEEVVVTGSRIVRNGYEAPTPVTVMGEEAINAAAHTEIADFVNQLPALADSVTPQNTTGTISSGTGGINALNLRGIGTARTLVLLDGQRSVPSDQSDQVDIGTIPQNLVSRVDIVTGGASATYGSDALAGVVDFILDKTFTGVKGELSGGVTGYGDDRNWKLALAGGFGFGNDRGHVLLSGEMTYDDGILGSLTPNTNIRSWLYGVDGVISNPAYAAGNGQPQYIVRPDVAADQATFGGIITSGPLKGITFGPGGTPYNFQYGTVGGAYMSGGGWQTSDVIAAESLDPRQAHQNVFTRISYDVTDNFNLYTQISWDHTDHTSFFGVGAELNTLVIQQDNAFIPAAVAAQVHALGLTSFTFGSWADGVHEGAYDARSVNRYVVGANGKFEAFGDTWNWDVYDQEGIARASEYSLGNRIVANYRAAIDAVVNPKTGAIVCRSTLTDPNNGCVPFDVFGTGVNSQAAYDYFEGSSYRYEHFFQDVISGTLRGEPFSSWAGPVSLAVNLEHRKEGVTGISDALALADAWYAGDFQPTIGHYEVNEGSAEVVVPLAKNTSWAEALDLNAAARGTDYSTSGYVTTWKVGLTYSPIDDVRFRATRSRDIRAPNLAELFTKGINGLTYVIDPFSGNPSAQAHTITTGNLALTPEDADTTNLGVVVQPRFLPGFSASVDYYNIDISNAIGTATTQQVINNCYAGETVFCSGLIFTTVNGVKTISTVLSQPFNFATENDRGIDYEASYTFKLADIADSWNGAIQMRFLATNYLRNYVATGFNPPTNRVGENSGLNGGLPNWKYTGTISYTNDPVSFTLTGRGVSAGIFDSSYVQCTSGCPAATVNNPTIDNNHVAGAFYLDTAITYDFVQEGGSKATLFFAVQNLTGKNPPVVPINGGLLYAGKPTNPLLYDDLGRVFHAGIRFKM